MWKKLFTVATATAALAACDTTTPNEGASVAVKFGTASTASAVSGAQYSRSLLNGDQLVLSGSNGTLTLTDIRFIVSKFELERDDAACEGLEGDAEDACEEFKAPPAFFDLPLGGGAAVAVSAEIPAGSYTEMKFKVKDVELDEDEDDKEGQENAAVLQAIKDAGFTNWPEKASMVVVGSFLPTGATAAVPFQTYFEAEIEIEREFATPVVISDAASSAALTVTIDPNAWFVSGTTVMDLSAFDYEKTGELLEFELELENGFGKVEKEDKDKDKDEKDDD